MRSLSLAVIIAAVLVLAAFTACDDSTTPEEKDESFILTVMVTDTLGQPLEGMAVWKQCHLSGTIPDLPIAFEYRSDAAPQYLPGVDSLEYCYPNPFNGVIFIAYSTSESRHATLVVEDWRGRHVRTVLDGVVPAGTHEAQWDQKDDSGERVMTGIYELRLTLTDTLETHLFEYSEGQLCTAYDDFFSNSYIFGWSLGSTGETGFFSTRNLDYFPSLQGFVYQEAYAYDREWLGIFWFDGRVTIRVSTVAGPGDRYIYYMSRDIDLVDGPNFLEFVFEVEDSMAIYDY